MPNVCHSFVTKFYPPSKSAKYLIISFKPNCFLPRKTTCRFEFKSDFNFWKKSVFIHKLFAKIYFEQWNLFLLKIFGVCLWGARLNEFIINSFTNSYWNTFLLLAYNWSFQMLRNNWNFNCACLEKIPPHYVHNNE